MSAVVLAATLYTLMALVWAVIGWDHLSGYGTKGVLTLTFLCALWPITALAALFMDDQKPDGGTA